MILLRMRAGRRCSVVGRAAAQPENTLTPACGSPNLINAMYLIRGQPNPRRRAQNAVDAGIAGYAKNLSGAGIPVSIAPAGDAFKSIYNLAAQEGSALSATTALSAAMPLGARPRQRCCRQPCYGQAI